LAPRRASICAAPGMRSRAAVAARLGPPLRVGGESDAGPDGFGAVTGLGAPADGRGTGAARASPLADEEVVSVVESIRRLHA